MGKGQRSSRDPASPASLRPVVIVLDENLAGQELRDDLLAVARANGATVELLTEHFARGTTDEVWLEAAAENRWAVITCDARIKRRPAEREILQRAGVYAFILRNELNSDEIRDALQTALPAICRRHRQLAPPVICHVSRHGEVMVVMGTRRAAIKR
jgi:nucleotide-binding universal stress UspA family protein